MALGVVDLPERERRTLPLLFMKSMIFLGLREGPKPVTNSISPVLQRWPCLRIANLLIWEEGGVNGRRLSRHA